MAASKRGQGEGSIYYDEKRERWVARVSVDGGRRLAHMAKTKRECQEWLNKTRLAAQQGTLATGPRQTVEQFLTQWLKDTAAPRVRPTTFRRYGEIVNQHCVPALGKVLVSKVTAQHLQRLYADKLESGLAPATVQYIHRVLHRAFEDAMRWDLISRNPCDLVDAPRSARPELHVLNEEQVCQLLRAAKDDPLEALYVLAVTTGMRQGELLGLKWEDIDTHQLHVRRTLHYIVGKGHVWGEPKSATSRRRLDLGALAILALNRHRERQGLARAFAGEKWQEQGLVFTNRTGGPLIPRNVFGRSFCPLLEKAELPHVRFHDLRHSAATMLLVQGTHPKVVQEILGHSAISVTMDVYSHVLPGLQEDAANRLSARLEATSEAIAKRIAERVGDRVGDCDQEEAAGGA